MSLAMQVLTIAVLTLSVSPAPGGTHGSPTDADNSSGPEASRTFVSGGTTRWSRRETALATARVSRTGEDARSGDASSRCDVMVDTRNTRGEGFGGVPRDTRLGGRAEESDGPPVRGASKRRFVIFSNSVPAQILNDKTVFSLPRDWRAGATGTIAWRTTRYARFGV